MSFTTTKSMSRGQVIGGVGVSGNTTQVDEASPSPGPASSASSPPRPRREPDYGVWKDPGIPRKAALFEGTQSTLSSVTTVNDSGAPAMWLNWLFV